MERKISEIKRDYKQELTDKLIKRIENAQSGLEQGLEWVSPWLECLQPPFNPVTGTRYKGINFISCMSAGFSDPRFLTFKNVTELAKQQGQQIHVKRGETGIPVFKAVQVEIGKSEPVASPSTAQVSVSSGEGSTDAKLIWTLAYAGTVFNASQVEGLEPLQPRAFDFEPIAAAEQLAEAMQLKTHLKIQQINQAKACYVPSAHAVRISPPEQFRSREAFYDTLLHEIGHSTAPLLQRDLTGRFGSPSYALEELVAELSSVFVGAELGIEHSASSHENHAAYLSGWLKALQDDKGFIFKAAAMATKACTHQMSILQEYRQERVMQVSSSEAEQSPKVAKKGLELEI